MLAQIQEYTKHWKLWNEFDEWYVEKTGIQLSNDPSTPWARIWVGFRGIEDKPSASWEEFLVDEVEWTWSTDSGVGWVKLIGDAAFGPGGKFPVHFEWYLGDNDQFLKITWRTINNWKDFADTRAIVRNGQIAVNDSLVDNWYRVYKSNGDLHADGALPTDASYNNLTDGLSNEYRLVNQKYVQWRWDSTFDKNGMPTISDVDINIVNINSKYGSNGYVEHSFKTGTCPKNSYIETIHYWRDAEAFYSVSLMVFEMNGINRNLVGDGGNTVKQLTPQGVVHPRALASVTAGCKIKGGGQTIDKISYYRHKSVSGGSGACRIGIQSHDSVNDRASGTWLTYGEENVGDMPVGTSNAAWKTVDVSSYTLAKDTIYWVVFDKESISGVTVLHAENEMTLRPPKVADLTCSWFLGKRSFMLGEWQAFEVDTNTIFILHNTSNTYSDYGLLGSVFKYEIDDSLLGFGYGTGAGLPDIIRPRLIPDQTTLYRTVLQIKPTNGAWKRDMDEAGESYFKSNNEADWKFESVASPPAAKRLYDDGSGPQSQGYNVFVEPTYDSGDQTEEWNGIDTNIPGCVAPPIQAGQFENINYRVDCYNPIASWEDKQGNTIDLNDWCTYEWWFKITDAFLANDILEVKGHWLGGGGGVTLESLRFEFKMVSPVVPPAVPDLGPFMSLI